jgi:hypothetical protein
VCSWDGQNGDGGIDIDDEAGVAEAHVLATLVPSHLTCLRQGRMVGETSFPSSNDGSCCTKIALDCNP